MRSGIDPAAVDPDVRPQDDLFGSSTARGSTRRRSRSDRARFGTFDILREESDGTCATSSRRRPPARPRPGTPARQVGDLYASFIDTDRIEELGARPAAGGDVGGRGRRQTSVARRALGRLGRDGVLGVLQHFVTRRALAGGLRRLPRAGRARASPTSPTTARRSTPTSARPTSRTSAGCSASPASRTPRPRPRRIMALETLLAAAHWDNVTNRDAIKTYNAHRPRRGSWCSRPGSLGTLASRASVRLRAFDKVVVRQPTFVTGASALRRGPVDVADWRAWHVCTPLGALPARRRRRRGLRLLRPHPLGPAGEAGALEARRRPRRGGRSARPSGSSTPSGGSRRPPRRACRSSSATSSRPSAGLLLARVDGARHARAGARQARRVHAQDRLPRRVARLLRPRDRRRPTWSATCAAARRSRSTATSPRSAGPIDRTEWFMLPQTVNAYYIPAMNEIVFPAAILQPPFFDLEADDAVNYGGIGAVIGHELGHGFDDQGSQFDGTGTLRDWWTDEDRARFEALRRRPHRAVRPARAAVTRPATRSTARSPSARTSATSAASPSATPPTASRSSDEPAARARRLHRGAALLPRLGAGLARHVAAGSEAERLLAARPAQPAWTCAPTPPATSPSSTRRSGSSEGDGMWLGAGPPGPHLLSAAVRRAAGCRRAPVWAPVARLRG